MNRKMLCLFLVVLAVAAYASQAWGSSLAVSSDTVITEPGVPFPSTPYDLSVAGNLDWVVAAVDEKAGASVIATQAVGILESTGFYAVWDGPQFSWTDGMATPVNTDGNSGLNLPEGVDLGTHLALPAGSGTISIWWCEYTGVGIANFSAYFADGTPVNVECPAATGKLTVLDWQTDTAQTLTFVAPNGTQTGVWGMAVSVVPEPSTLTLLACGLFGLVAYAWRKRK